MPSEEDGLQPAEKLPLDCAGGSFQPTSFAHLNTVEPVYNTIIVARMRNRRDRTVLWMEVLPESSVSTQPNEGSLHN
jgi:hypothetical protein